MTAEKTFAGLVALVIVVALGGCSVPESKLHEYRETAEQLRADLDEQLPAEVTDNEPIVEGATHEGAQHGPGGKPSSPAWWQVNQDFSLVNEPGTSEQVATLLHDYLESNGWSYSRARGEDTDSAFAEGYRLTDDDGGQWYIEIIWAQTRPDYVETLSLYIGSPTTTLGEDPPQREFTHPD